MSGEAIKPGTGLPWAAEQPSVEGVYIIGVILRSSFRQRATSFRRICNGKRWQR
jgi:thioredoxin reductase